MRSFAALLALVALLASACAGARGGASTSGSGVSGVVLAGPQCPVVTGASPCPDEPVAGARVRIRSADGSFEVIVRSDERGRFRTALPPGGYELRAVVEDGPAMSAKPVTVTVPEGSYADVVVPLDTGIR
jgi:hypothetical protein